MKQDKIKQLLPTIGSTALGHRTGWVLATCPMRWNHGGHASDAFAVSYNNKKKSRVKCLSCGYSGDLLDMLFAIKAGLKKNPDLAHLYQLSMAANLITNEFEEMELVAADIPDYEEPVVSVETEFPEWWLDSFKPVTMFPQGMTYLHKRGLTDATIKALDIRFDPLAKRVCFPFRNFKGKLMGMQGRSIFKLPPGTNPYNQYGFQKKRNSHVWMGEHTLDLDKPVVLCEGPFDYAKIFQVYTNVAASFTSGLSASKIKRLGDADTIITFYDYGKGGDAARQSIHKYLPAYHIVDIIPTQEEDDAGSMELATIDEYLSPHLHLG